MQEIRILVPVAPSASMPSEEIVLKAYPASYTQDITLSAQLLESGPKQIITLSDEKSCVAGLIKNAKMAEAQGVSGLIIDCMADPGIKEIRSEVSIPIIAPAYTSMSFAAMFGWKFAILALYEESMILFDQQVKRYGFTDCYMGCHEVDATILDITSNKDQAIESLGKASEYVVKKMEIDSIILGCTDLTGFSSQIEKELNQKNIFVKVIDPMLLSLMMMKQIIIN